MTNYLPAEVENAIVGQKDEIIRMINAARYASELRDAAHLIRHNSELWAAIGYGYKTGELNQRIRNAARVILEAEEAYLVPLRKNDKTRRGTENHIKELEVLTATC